MEFDSPRLMAGSAAVLLALGSVHLLYTFNGNKLYPRDTHLERQMALVSPVLTRHTTMWEAWVGFNASHSFGAMFFGLVYGYLGWFEPAFLFASPFLLGLGLLLLLGYAWLGFRYWFRIPIAGILISLALYLAAIVQHFRG